MEEKDFLDRLGEIRKVDAPAFLLTRIRQSIANTAKDRISVTAVRRIAFLFIMLMILNFLAIRQIRPGKNERNIAQAFQLMPNNDFYE